MVMEEVYDSVASVADTLDAETVAEWAEYRKDRAEIRNTMRRGHGHRGAPRTRRNARRSCYKAALDMAEERGRDELYDSIVEDLAERIEADAGRHWYSQAVDELAYWCQEDVFDIDEARDRFDDVVAYAEDAKTVDERSFARMLVRGESVRPGTYGGENYFIDEGAVLEHVESLLEDDDPTLHRRGLMEPDEGTVERAVERYRERLPIEKPLSEMPSGALRQGPP